MIGGPCRSRTRYQWGRSDRRDEVQVDVVHLIGGDVAARIDERERTGGVGGIEAPEVRDVRADVEIVLRGACSVGAHDRIVRVRVLWHLRHRPTDVDDAQILEIVAADHGGRGQQATSQSLKKLRHRSR